MATLCPGIQYGLSSQKNFSETKELIFVKLTDSAYRAIEEFVRNRNKFSSQQTPTIQFRGNEGQLEFPSANSSASFSFSMSTTQDMEGPGGSFECITQNGPPRGPLELLNPIPRKIRIHANDDIYAATKQRMTVAEETHKNKCTREIKPNQTDIGRRVKVKQMANGGRSSIPQMPPARMSNGSSNERTTPHPSMRDSLLKSSYQTSSNPPVSKPPILNGMHSNNGMHQQQQLPQQQQHLSANGLSSNHVSSSKPQQNKPTQPDILKRPLKERLIHLLALRPYKKVELFERLNREGVREKGSMSSVLKQISVLKDNAYHLNRACWHDVRENWPFYSESEKQILKRRKPQNLTPPGSSDSTSSGSGQSPTSTHPGSPPLPVPVSTKRPGYYDGADGFPTKRQRVSHYKKPTEPTVNPPPAENKSQRKPVTDSRDTSNMNPRSRESPTTTLTPTNQALTNGHHPSNGYANGSTREKRSALSDDEDEDEEMNNSRKRHCDNSYNRVGFETGRQETLERSPYENGFADKRESNDYNSTEGVAKEATYQNGEVFPQDRWAPEVKRETNKYDTKYDRDATPLRVSPDSQTEPMPTAEVPVDESQGAKTPPDYLTEYTTIRNYDQRKRYKDDFNEYYNEYKVLHETVDRVSRRFIELEDRLKHENSKSPKYRDLKKQIMKEYKEIKKSTDHQKAKLRFQYLHEKLSHIKNLVKEYDDSITNEQQYTNHRY
ncbi:RNA polymerase II elongation factor Ell [Harmonia axyridis]|uniref:RNA polymerase II elongation factor Ell n=1 Tax=Harmonia axyridis TaxID=115357 RepID=UPI001E276F8F|nr:RNA polymerase II elongation factor Ell [Harmonia axyridis]